MQADREYAPTMYSSPQVGVDSDRLQVRDDRVAVDILVLCDCA